MSNSDELGGGPVQLAHEHAFRIGLLDVEPATRGVVRNGRRETLEPRVMQVLVVLARAHGRVVGRDELVARCWGGRIVGDNAVHRTIKKLRELGAGAGYGAFEIETIPRVGYRLVRLQAMPVTAEPAPAALSEPADIDPRGLAGTGSWDRRQTLLAGFGLAAAAAGTAAVSAARQDPTEARVKSLIEQSDNALRLGSADADGQGVGFLEEAVAIAPRNAAAWGRLALVRYIIAEHSATDQIGEAVAGTQAAAQRALSLDHRQPDALAALALLPPYFGEWYAAEKRMNSVLAVDPAHLPTLDAHSFLLSSVGRVKEGSQQRLSLSRREPLHAGIQFRLVYAYWLLGRLPEADRAADRALQLWPKHWGVWSARLWTLAFSGRGDRALAHVQDIAGRPDAPPHYFAPLEAAMLALAGGSRRDAEQAIDGLMAQVAQHPSASVNAILVFNGLGELDRAFDVAEAYLLERGPLLASVRWRPGQPSINDQRRRKTAMLFLPVSAPMRADPRFRGLVEDIGLAAYWEAANVIPDHRA